MVQVLLAAQHGQGEVLKLLAKAGADLDVRSSPAATHSHALCLLLWKKHCTPGRPSRLSY
jgi:hypothetical protein